MLRVITASLTRMFQGIINIFDVLVAFLINLVGSVLDIVVSIFTEILTVLVNMLPDMPNFAQTNISFSPLGFANNYIPISDVLLMLPLWAAIFTGIGIYKLVKLIRG